MVHSLSLRRIQELLIQAYIQIDMTIFVASYRLFSLAFIIIYDHFTMFAQKWTLKQSKQKRMAFTVNRSMTMPASTNPAEEASLLG